MGNGGQQLALANAGGFAGHSLNGGEGFKVPSISKISGEGANVAGKLNDQIKLGFKDVPDIGEISKSNNVNKVNNVDLKDVEKVGTEGVGNSKIDYNLIKDYVRDVESRTGIKLSKVQVEELKNALRNK